MKKIKGMNTNVLIVLATLFITIYSTVGNGLANAFFQMEPTYLYGSMIGWFFQFVWTVIVFAVAMMVISIAKILIGKFRKTKNGDGKSEKKSKVVSNQKI